MYYSRQNIFKSPIVVYNSNYLLEAKYCPRVASVLRRQKNTKNSCDLDLWPMTLKFNSVLEVVGVHVRPKFYQAKSSGSWVIKCTRFWTTVYFDREYLWNGSSSRQAENGVSNYDFSAFDESNLVNVGPLKKNDLDLWPMTLKFSGFRAVVKEHAAVNELFCVQRKKLRRKHYSSSLVIMRRIHKSWRQTARETILAAGLITWHDIATYFDELGRRSGGLSRP